MLHLSPAITAYILTLAAVLGAALGSFSTCAAARVTAGDSFLTGRSRCDSCGHVLSPLDLIPVFSWLLLRRRCRYCGARIPSRSFWMELLCAAAFVGLVLRFDVTALTAQYLLLTVLLLVMALVDYDAAVIPDKLLIAIFTDWLAFAPFVNGGALWATVRQGMLAGLCAAGPLLALSLVMDRLLGRESLGGGDIKLFFVCGLFFSWREILFLLILSCLLGIVFSLVSLKTAGDPENPKAFPFGPAIALGVYVSLLAAEPAVSAYLSLF